MAPVSVGMMAYSIHDEQSRENEREQRQPDG